jgi:hypothetical protein
VIGNSYNHVCIDNILTIVDCSTTAGAGSANEYCAASVSPKSFVEK